MSNELETPGEPRELVWLNATRMPKGAREYRYFLQVQYMSTTDAGWLDIQPGDSLTLLIDGQPVKFESTGSLNTRKESKEGVVHEIAIYQVSPGQLRQIAYAKSVQVQIRGQRGTVEREFKPDNFKRFQQFILQTVGV